ncbi:hypothetical protein [Alkalihalobacterium elongatum]|uniref:hypothetical protein n=1 Tax=Alkalihalobacterium elongatum TaxID=2675466 RepID=UPI001C1FD7D8|nr:hypothetical protein [Alkalihalobacterium elongatum]
MSYVNGQIICGEFDKDLNEFAVHSVKHHLTETSLKHSQIAQLCNYLKKHKDEASGQIISLYDQMLIPLSIEEMKAILQDLEQIQNMYQ